MPTSRSRELEQMEFTRAADEYLKALPMEHFMESYTQGFQRKVTLATLDPVPLALPAFQVFNELLVQERVGRGRRLVQVVPDNMIVLHDQKIIVAGSYDIPFQPARPFCVMEYVSKHSVRKDYDDNHKKYERDLKVPYYLLFYPDHEELILFHRGRVKYVSVKPNAAGRYEIPEVEIEVGLVDKWMRFWFRGRLLPMPSDLQQELEVLQLQFNAMKVKFDTTTLQLDTTKAELGTRTLQLDTTRQERDAAHQRLSAAEDEINRLREQLERLRGKGA